MASCVLELISFDNLHTGVRIPEELLKTIKNWQIEESIGFILTDNGANMIKAFKDARIISQKQVKADQERARQQDYYTILNCM